MQLLFVFLLISAIVTTAVRLKPHETLQNANNQFTAKIFSEIVNQNKNKSVVVSAFSLFTPLILLGSVSEGPTHDEILNALGLADDITKNNVLTLILYKISSLKWLPEYIKGIQLKQASRLYVPLGYDVDNHFATASKYIYECEAINVNFTDKEHAANKINTWIEEQTRHGIKDLIDPNSLSSETQGLLVNAVYFKGSWKYPFDKAATRTEDFYVNKQNKIQIPTMHITEDFQYAESDKLKSKILALHHVGEQATLIIVLPHDVDGINELIENLKSPNILDEESTRMASSRVQMNITKMFSDESNINRVLKNEEKLSISDAEQKVLIEINEEGNDAAIIDAFIKAETTPVQSVPTSQLEFVANHSFAFFLKTDNSTILNGIFYGS